MSRNLSFLALAALVAMAISTPASAANREPEYRISKEIPLGEPDHWDYVVFDPDTSRVYVAHGDRVTVVDGHRGTVIGSVMGMPGGTHGIGISHATGEGFTDDGRAGVVVVFDLKTLKVIKRIKGQVGADGIVMDPSSGHVYVIDGHSGKLTVVDPRSDTVVATIDVGSGLEFGVSGENGKLYVDGEEKHEIVRIDTTTNKIDARWPMATCRQPHGLAIDRAHHRLFSSCGNRIMVVMNSDNGAVIASLPIGQGTDAAAFDPSQRLAFSSNRDGTLSVIKEISPDKFVVLAPISTEIGARTMALDPKSGRIFLVTADMAVDPSAAPSDWRRRYQIRPGSVKLLFLDRRH